MQENFFFARHVRVGSGAHIVSRSVGRLESNVSRSINPEKTLEIYLHKNAEPAGRLHWQFLCVFYIELSILHEIRKRKAKWIGHVLRRNCLLKQVIEGKIEGEMEVIRRRRKLLDDLKDRRGYSHLKEEALDCTVWRNRFGRGLWTCRQTEY